MSAILIIFIILFVLEAAYIRVAERLGVCDTPNGRSSHRRPTVRGGGIVAVLAALAFFVWSRGEYPWLLAGLSVIAAVSFADDLRGAPIWVRLLAQVVGMALIMAQCALWGLPWWGCAAVLVGGVAFLNAYNFMDGINGSAGLYTLVSLGTLWWVNADAGFIDWRYLCAGVLGAAVFCFFNFRTSARCFAGDVGSLAMGVTVLFPLLMLVGSTGSWAWVVFVSVYGTDAALTIIRRLIQGKNIFEAHRMHAYQLLCNELGHSHLAVASAYAALQLAINAGALLLPLNGYVYLGIIVVFLMICYVFICRRVLG